MDSFSASSFGGSYNSSNNSSNDPVLGNSKNTIHPAMPPMPWKLSTEDPPPKQRRGDEPLDESNQSDDHNENDRSPLSASVKNHKRDTFFVTLEMILLKTRQKKDRQMQQVKDSEEFEGFLLREREALLLGNETALASKCKRKKRNENRSSSSSFSAPHQAPSPPVAETTLQRPNGTTVAGEPGRKHPPPSSYKQTNEEEAKESPSATRDTQKRKLGRPRKESSVKTTLLRPDGNTMIQEPSPESSKQTKEQGAKESTTAKRDNPKRKLGRPKKVKPQEDQDDATKEPAPKRSRVLKPKAKRKPRAKKFSLPVRNCKNEFASCSSGNESEDSEYVPGS